MVWLSGLGAVVAIAAALAVLTSQQAITFGFFILAIAPWLILFPGWRLWPGWKYIFAAVISAVALLAGMLRVLDQPNLAEVLAGQPAPSSATATPPTVSTPPRPAPSPGMSAPSPAVSSLSKAGVTITAPSPGSPSGSCAKVSGTIAGQIPAGAKIVLAVALEGGISPYALSLVDQSTPGVWKAEPGLGDPKNDRMVGRRFTIDVLLIDEREVKYSMEIAKVGGTGWWQSPVIPPYAERGPSTDTTRTASAC